MKKNTIITAFALFTISLNFKAQVKVELVPLGGYIFQSTYFSYDGAVEFSAGPAYGGMINFKPHPYFEFGFSVINQDSKANVIIYAGNNYKEKVINAGIIDYKLNFVRNIVISETSVITPFMGMDLGATHFYEKEESSSDYLRFSMGFKGGVKLNINKNLNFRIQPQLEIPFQNNGFGFYGTYGSGPMLQFGVMGGIGFTLKGKNDK